MVEDVSEIIDHPRRKTLSFYLVLFLVVAPFWAAVPLAWVYAIYVLKTGRFLHYGYFGRSLFLLALCEVFFSIYYYHLSRRISGPSPYGPGNLMDLQAAFNRVLKAGMANLPEDGKDLESLDGPRAGSPAETIIQLDHDDPRAVDFRNSLRTWFGRVPWSSIRVNEVRRWLYWSIFNAHLPPIETLPGSHRTAIDDALDLLQKRAGKTISDGPPSNGIKPLLLTLDNVNILWRPFTFYALIALINWLCAMKYERTWGLRQESHGDFEYLIRVPPHWNSNKDPRPIVLIHGLGLGIFQYYLFIADLLTRFSDRPLLIPLQPHISQNIFHRNFLKPMSRHEFARRLAELMHRLGWAEMSAVTESTTDEEDPEEAVKNRRQGVTMLSHSNGSYGHAWMLKGYSYMITRSCFVDPVTFCSWEGDVCYNFIYRPCTSGLELLMRYFVGTELGVANLLQRHFDWSSNALWYEEIPGARDPSKTMFLLGGKDAILRAERVKRYLTSHGVGKGLWYDPDGQHGQALILGGRGHHAIMQWLSNP